jgi:hypothetical protein
VTVEVKHAPPRVETLTLAQAKAGLIAAAKSGLIDGSELNESWFQTLRRDVYNALKKSKSKEEKGSKKGKAESAKETKSPPSKKTSPVITGFMKFNDKFGKSVDLKGINTVDSLKENLTSEPNAQKMHDLAVGNGWIDASTGKATIKDYAATYEGFGLNEEESKSARNWFPYFYVKVPNGRASGN